MSDYRFRLVVGTHLSQEELNEAAVLLSQSYTRWRDHPRNVDPLDTDTSPAVYARTMRQGNREVLLYYEGDRLCGVYVHGLSPDYDQHPLRKLSYLGVSPVERGYEPLKTAFGRYAAFVREQGEDVIITSDLEQATLNSLLEHAGFREVVDRNETYFLLSRLLHRQLFAVQQVAGDFAIDQVITVAGKQIRRSKKLYQLRTTPYDSYTIYRQQQLKRVQRSLPPENLARLREALQPLALGIYFISDFDGAITLEDEAQGGYDAHRAMMGKHVERVLPEIIDPAERIVYLLPGSEPELRAIAGKTVFRPGFFDLLCFCLKILGSFYVVSAATPYQVRYALERPLASTIPLRYIDLVEGILTPTVDLLPDQFKPVSDGTLRAGYRYSGPYVELSQGQYHTTQKPVFWKKTGFSPPHGGRGAPWATRKDLMIEDVLRHKGDTRAPVLYLGHDPHDAPALARLHAEAARRRMPVVVLDLGTALTRRLHEELLDKDPTPNPYFGIVGIRDFYQVPVMLEALGLRIEAGIDLTI